MKKLLALLFALSVLVSCSNTSEPIEKGARRSVLVYMEAKNNLASNAVDDLDEMLRATIPDSCRLLVFLSAYDCAPQLMEVKNGTLVSLLEYEKNTSAVDPKQLKRVVADAARLAPAKERGLVFWSHAFGWQQSARRSRSFGWENSTHTMSNTELADALKGADLDYIYFDACFMGSAEVAYELRRAADYLVASPAEVPGGGMPYNLTVPALFAKNIRAGLIETIDIVADYYDENPGAARGCPRTLSLIDLRKMELLATETKRIVALGKEPAEGFVPQQYASLTGSYRNRFFDLEHWADAIGADAQWHDALNDAVVYERHSPMIWNSTPLVNCCGLSVFIPNEDYDFNAFGYSTLQWPQFVYNIKPEHP